MAKRARPKRPKIADPVTEYARAVVAGKIVTGSDVRLQCARHLDDLKTAKARGWKWNLGHPSRPGAPAQRGTAYHAIEFIEKLPQYKGRWAGQRLHLADWEKFIVGSLFGWVSAATGKRRFKIALILIARKNGKSTLASAIALYCLVADGEMGAEVYSAATKRDQARIVFDASIQMVRRSKALRERVGIYKRNMNVLSTASKYEPLGADEDGLDGLNVHCGIVDELHAHKNRVVWDALEGGTGAREQPLLIGITTAGFTRAVAWQLRTYCRKVLRGGIADVSSDRWFFYIAEPDEDDDWQDEKIWIKANPNLGVSVTLEELREKCAQAQQMASAQNVFRTKRLNQWVEQETRWIPMEKWDECSGDVDAASLAGRECFFGLDLSSKQDMTSLALLFPPIEGDPKWSVLPFYWSPQAQIAEISTGNFGSQLPYDVWRDNGLLREVPGEAIDQEQLRRDYKAIFEPFRVIAGGFDPWNASQMSIWLQEDGFKVYEVRQGPRTLSEPMKELEKLVITEMLAHGGHDVLRWNAENVAIRVDDQENIVPSKKKSAGRIDGIVAAIMAMAVAMTKMNEGRSPYEDRGLLFLG